MDISAIITASLTGVVTLIVCLINNHYQTSRTNALISYRLEQLEHKVDKHNNLVERMYKVEEHTALQQDEINRHKERLRALEDKGA
jgi:hypothetical protein